MQGIEIEIVAISLIGEVIYSASIGGSEFWILRGKSIAKILKGGNEAIIASGYPKEGDVLILASKTFFDFFSEEEIRKTLLVSGLKDISEVLAPKLSSIESAGVGAVFIKLGRAFSENITEVKMEEFTKQASMTSGENAKKPLFNLKAFKIGFLNFFQKPIFRVGEIYVKSQDSFEKGKKQKTAASVGLILVVLLLVSSIFGVRQKRLREQKLSYDLDIKQAEHFLNEAESLYFIDVKRAREIFVKAGEIISKLEKEHLEDTNFISLKTVYDDKKSKLLGEYRKKVELLLDLSLLSNNFEGKRMFLSGSEIFIIDKGGEKIVATNFDGKGSRIVTIPADLKGSYDLAVYADKLFLVNDQGLFEMKGKKVDEISKKDWFGDVLISTYAGNLYLLEKDSSIIWRFLGSGGGFSTKRNWLAEGQAADLTDAIDWVIDGSIWILTKNYGVLRFDMGNERGFEISGVIPSIENINALYTDEKSSGVYLLDNQEKRVVVVNKDGEYVAQYFFEGPDDINDMVVFEREKKIILLKEGKLYSVGISHLD